MSLASVVRVLEQHTKLQLTLTRCDHVYTWFSKFNRDMRFQLVTRLSELYPDLNAIKAVIFINNVLSILEGYHSSVTLGDFNGYRLFTGQCISQNLAATNYGFSATIPAYPCEIMLSPSDATTLTSEQSVHIYHNSRYIAHLIVEAIAKVDLPRLEQVEITLTTFCPTLIPQILRFVGPT